jgi:hypothetical protein
MRILYLVIPLIVFLATNSFAIERKKFGIGVIAGNPDAITGKYMMKNGNAIDAGLGWKTKGDNKYTIYGDYLFYKYDFIKVQNGKLPLYFGGGVRYITYSGEETEKKGGKKKDDEFGIRIPVGIEYLFRKPSLGIFLELVPVLNLTPDTNFEFGSGIGIRFFF